MKRFLTTIGDYVDVLDDPNVIDFKEKLEENPALSSIENDWIN